MSIRREFRTFQFRQAVYRVHSAHFPAVSRCIRRMWNELEEYIALHPPFAESLAPLAGPPENSEDTSNIPRRESSGPLRLPESVRRMLRAADSAGVGPMAAVAGTFAQIAAEAGQAAGDRETVVENGGDICMYLEQPLVLGLWVGPASPFQDLAFSIQPADGPLAVCSSSSRFGHSISFGECDLFTVFSRNAALADAAATGGCNQVRHRHDLQPAVESAVQLPGVEGAVAVKDKNIAIAGKTPQLIRHADAALGSKITRHSRAGDR